MGTMGMKIGTKTWADKPAADQAQTEAPNLTPDQKQRIGADDLNAVLNKAADKNWTDSSKRVAGHGNAAMDKDAFFKLMLAQLKNQDPMNPLKNHEMAAQLAQFSSLEQMTNMNATLSKIENKNSQPQDFQALNLIGKTVAGDSSRVVRTQFDKEHDFNFLLPQDAAEANVKLMTAKGDLVREYKLTNLKSGNNKVSWNGKDEGGNLQGAGEYFFQVDAKNAVGHKIPVKTEFQGEISGLSFTSEGPVLQVGSQSIKMKDVRQITDSSAKHNDQNVKNVAGLDLKNTGDVAQTDIKQENTSQALPKPTGNVMTDVAMSRDLLNQLQQQKASVK
jgi:flagellar basal-body rod modification protein FlgD